MPFSRFQGRTALNDAEKQLHRSLADKYNVWLTAPNTKKARNDILSNKRKNKRKDKQRIHALTSGFGIGDAGDSGDDQQDMQNGSKQFLKNYYNFLQPRKPGEKAVAKKYQHEQHKNYKKNYKKNVRKGNKYALKAAFMEEYAKGGSVAKGIKATTKQYGKNIGINFKENMFLVQESIKDSVKNTKMMQHLAQKRRNTRAFIQAFKESGIKGAAMLQANKIQLAVAKGKKKLVENIKRIVKKALLSVLGILLMFLVLIIAVFVLILPSGAGALFGSYEADYSDIVKAEERMCQHEAGLIQDIHLIETNYPDYDFYELDIAPIGHNAFDLSNYLAALNCYTLGETYVYQKVDDIFDAMYTVTVSENTAELRTVQVYDESLLNDDGTYGGYVDEEIECSVLYYTVEKNSLFSVTYNELTDEQKARYYAYQDTGGLIQKVGSPVSANWIDSVITPYGTVYNSDTGDMANHAGIDIALSSGDKVYSPIAGTITEMGSLSNFGQYVVISNDKYKVKLAHLNYTGFGLEEGLEVGKGAVLAYVCPSSGAEFGDALMPSYYIHVELTTASNAYLNPNLLMSTRITSLVCDTPTGYGSEESGAFRNTVGRPSYNSSN